MNADAEALADAAVELLPELPTQLEARLVRMVAAGDPIGLLVMLADAWPTEAPDRGRLARVAAGETISLANDRALKRQSLLNRATALCYLEDWVTARTTCEQVLTALDFADPASCVDVLEHCATCGVDTRPWTTAVRESCVLAEEDLLRLDALNSLESFS